MMHLGAGIGKIRKLHYKCNIERFENKLNLKDKIEISRPHENIYKVEILRHMVQLYDV